MQRKRFIMILVLILLCSYLGQFFALEVYAEVKTLRVAFNSNLAPYHFIDKDGKYKGMHIDMMNWIAERNNLQIIYIPYETDYECITALNSSAVEVVLGHKRNDIAATELQYTGELSSSSLCLIMSNELAGNLKNTTNFRAYSAAIEYGSTSNSYLTKMGIQRYLARGNQISVIEALINGQTDMALAVYDCSKYLLKEAGLEDKYTILRSYISPISHAMLVRREDLEINKLLDSGLTEMRASGNYGSIYKKWLAEDDQMITQGMMLKIIIIVTGIACGIVIIILFNFVINRILKRKVAEKTKELFDANAELDRRMIQIQSDSRIFYGMIEFATSGMVSFGKDYYITLINNAALQIGGVRDICLGSDVRELNVFGEIIKIIKYDIFSLGNYGVEGSRPVIIELGNGENKRSYRYNIYRSRTEIGISSILLTVEDVTSEELEKQESFELAKTRSLNRLVAGIAHEIKNPLMAIRTAASLLKEQGDDPEVQKAFVRFVPNEVDRINQLIEGLINYARPVKGEREMVNLATVIKECLYFTHIASRLGNLCFSTDLDDSVVIYVNRDRIKQSMINIIMNGIESMEKKLQNEPTKSLFMSISVYKDMKFACACINDEGVGMSEVDIKLCAEPFYTTKAAGTGLGLALVQQFMEENDGILSIHSEVGCFTETMLKFRRCDTDETKDTDN